MQSQPICQRCRAYMFFDGVNYRCNLCGSTMPIQYQPQPYFLPDFQKCIDNTKYGILLMIVGFILSMIPYINIIGGILGLIGLILIYMGRKAFSLKHQNFVTVAVVLLIILIIIALCAIPVYVAFTIFSTMPKSIETEANKTAPKEFLESVIYSILVPVIILGIIGGIANVLLVYELENPIGKKLLILGYVVTAILAVSMLFFIPSIVEIASQEKMKPEEVSQKISGMTMGYEILGKIGYIIYAIAYYIPYKRIINREVPESLVMPYQPPLSPYQQQYPPPYYRQY